jgi:hypothetical protein
MPYKFTFDLSRISRFFFVEVTKASYQKGMHEKMGKAAHKLIRKFKIQEATGLDLSDAVVLLQDLIDLQSRNLIQRERFQQSTRRVLFLPHCSRKHMDSQCKAAFDPSIPSYICAHCSPDCLVNKSVSYAQKKGYDVYVLPGASCIPRILKAKHYEGAVGVACGEEVRMSGQLLDGMGVAGQSVPLIKNGCANTAFSLETLFRILSQERKTDAIAD